MGTFVCSAFLTLTLGTSSSLSAPAPSTTPELERKPGKVVEIPSYTVKKGTLKKKVQLDAIFEAAEMTPIKLQTKTVLEFTVIDAVAHGAPMALSA